MCEDPLSVMRWISRPPSTLASISSRNEQKSYNLELWIRDFLKGAAYLPR